MPEPALLEKIMEFVQGAGPFGGPGGDPDVELVNRFISAVKSGPDAVKEFLAQNPDLTADQYQQLAQYLLATPQQTTAPSSDGGFDPLSPLKTIVSPDIWNQAGSDIADFVRGDFGADKNAGDIAARKADALKLLAASAKENGVQITTAEMGSGDYVNQIAKDAGLNPQQAGEAILGLNPQFPREGNLPAGTAYNTGIGTYTWKLGDTAQTVEQKLGYPPGTLVQWWLKVGKDPEAFQYEEQVPIPMLPATIPGEGPGGAGMRGALTAGGGEQTQPVLPPDATLPPGQTQVVPGGDGTLPPGGEGSLNQAFSELPGSVLLASLLSEGLDPSERARMIGQGGNFDLWDALLRASGAIGDVDRRTAFSQLLENQPSTDYLLEQLRSLGQTGAPGNSFLESPGGVLDVVNAIMDERMGSRTSNRLMSPEFLAQLLADYTEQGVGGGTNNIVAWLEEAGVI